MAEKEQAEATLTETNHKIRKLKDDNEDLKVKSLALASQKQILQMKYNEIGGEDKRKERGNSTNSEQIDDDKDNVEDLDTLVAELKDSSARCQAENDKMRKEMQTIKSDLEAERKIFESKLKIDKEFKEEDFEPKMRELEYLIHTYGVHIDNKNDYMKEILHSKTNKSKAWS